jgi:type I restriction enzyme, S subunit
MLSSLDVKIDLLNRQNKTLEAMAETLFRQWFIEEAKDDWEELALKELVKVIDNRGKTPPYQDFKTEHPIIEVNALTNDGRLVNYSVIRKFVDDSIFQTWFRQHLEDLDILFSTVGSIGSIGMFFKNGACVAQNVIGIRAMNKISNFYLYQWLLYNQEEIRELDIGSVQPSIKVPHLLALQIRIPDKNILDKFDLVIKGFIDKLKSNQEQIQTLENLRDTLLPKLMSGEIRVQH